jgi:hypothetical protein
MKRQLYLVGVLLSSFMSLGGMPAAPSSITQELFFQGNPSEQQIQKWKELPGPKNITVWLDHAGEWNLAPFLKFDRLDGFRIQTELPPQRDSLHLWKELATKGVTWVSLSGGIPLSHEVEILKEIGFSQITLVLLSYPSEEDAARISTLETPLLISFFARRYPLFMERDALDLLPVSATLFFVTDYWPWYSHMDLFNLLPHEIRLRVRDSFPSEDHWPYLHYIRRLKGVEIVTGFEYVEKNTWEKFQSIPVTWITQNWIPSEQALLDFETSTQRPKEKRKLLIDQDQPLTSEEKSLLKKRPFAVHWLRAAPGEFRPSDLPFSSETGPLE